MQGKQELKSDFLEAEHQVSYTMTLSVYIGIPWWKRHLIKGFQSLLTKAWTRLNGWKLDKFNLETRCNFLADRVIKH